MCLWLVGVNIFEGFCQKKPRVRNFSARNSGAAKGCASFMGAWDFLAFSAGKTYAHKLLDLGGGRGLWSFFEGGMEVPILFLWASRFFRSCAPEFSRKERSFQGITRKFVVFSKRLLSE